ncbi:MAG TPA: TIGR03435 family protein [Acidobacteriaceae bacterium]|nr:TIGR03435 family protein [Acidobacteriaceae bacterium]
MVRSMATAVVFFSCLGMLAQARPKFEAFEVATVKPVDVGPKAGRMFKMDGPHRWTATNFTLKNLVALAYDLNPRTISGGPDWFDSQKFVIEAVTPGDLKPTRAEQMQMLRALLVERFGLKFHRQDKEFSIYELRVAKGGPKLKPTTTPDAEPQLFGVVYPDRIQVPARNVSMDDFVAMLQRATLDRPTVNKTRLVGRFDFDLTFAQDESQYEGQVPKAPEDTQSPPLFTAVQEQLGLRLVATRGTVSAMVVDGAEKPGVD